MKSERAVKLMYKRTDIVHAKNTLSQDYFASGFLCALKWVLDGYIPEVNKEALFKR